VKQHATVEVKFMVKRKSSKKKERSDELDYQTVLILLALIGLIGGNT
jgi:hypothetical protein